jgi:PAS domain S-box-containing protein
MGKIVKWDTLLNVLCLEDVLNDAVLINGILADAGFQVKIDITADEKEYLTFIKEVNYDIILADYTVSGFDIYTALNWAKEFQPDVPFICISGTIGDVRAIDLLKKGATDYVSKDRLFRLPFAVRLALENAAKQKEWRRTDEALQQANNELQLLHNNLDQAVFSVDIINNKMLHVSIAHKTVFGLSQEAFFNNPKLWYELIIPEDKPIVDAGYPVLFAGKNLQHEFRIIHSDGQIRWIETKMNPTLDASGKLIRIDGISSDVTKRKQAEEALRESQIKYQAIFESTGTATFISDEQTVIIMANNECFSITGYTPKELQGQKWSHFFATESLQKMIENHNIRRQNPNSAPKKYEVKLVNKTGELRDVILEIGMIPGTQQSIVSLLDITERKKAGLELIKALEKAEESDRLKTIFLNNISHEIRTPFNGILGFLSIIQTNEITTSERDEYIGFINQSADRLMQTINDIVEMSQIQAGQMKLVITETNLQKLIDKLAYRFGTLAEKQNLRFNIINNLPLQKMTLFIDEIKLKTILSNLINNALKFTKSGSIEIGISEKDNILQFYVRDTGIGISENKQEAIFELFKQSDSSNNRQFEGLGLGLSITKSYIKMLGGSIYLESEPGKGSTFYFTIPV